MTQAQYLERRGWIEYDRRQYGCIWKVWWRDPETGELLPQGHAIATAKQREKARSTCR